MHGILHVVVLFGVPHESLKFDRDVLGTPSSGQVDGVDGFDGLCICELSADMRHDDEL